MIMMAHRKAKTGKADDDDDDGSDEKKHAAKLHSQADQTLQKQEGP